jgi:hypothetical protein
LARLSTCTLSRRGDADDPLPGSWEIERETVSRVGPPTVFVGFSMGSVPASYLAGRYRRRLWSFASADRGDLMIWQSPASRPIRDEAQKRGFSLDDYTSALSGLNPVNSIARIDRRSRFALGSFDRYVPRARTVLILHLLLQDEWKSEPEGRTPRPRSPRPDLPAVYFASSSDPV